MLCAGCKKSSVLEQALSLAGENRKELERVLDYFREEPLKYEAAKFLIENMPGHYSIVNDDIEIFYNQLEDFLAKTPVNDYRDSKIIRDSIQTMAFRNMNIQSMVKADITFIKSDFLINSIDEAFEKWQSLPWAQHLNFDEFCEYILPYKVDNYFMFEEDWPSKLRNSIQKEVLYKLETFRYSSELRNSAYWACKTINKYLRETICPEGSPLESPLVYRLTTLAKVPYGTCSDRCPVTVGFMRSLGIPVMIDFTYQWPFRSLGHTWNIVLMNNGQNAAFGGGEDGPGELHMPGQRMAKVYRKTYAINKEILKLKQESAYVPPAFHNIHMKDVTVEYMKSTSIEVPVQWKSGNDKYAYLAVFNDKEWIPVCYGIRQGNKYIFENIGNDIVYLPVFYTEKGIEPFSDAFILDLKNNIHYLGPDPERLQKVVLDRKFGLSQVMYNHAWNMINGKIEAANNELFNNPKTIHTIKKWSVRKDSVILDSSDTYRYWRYVSSPYGQVNISKLDFYEPNKDTPLSGQILGTDETYFYGDTIHTKHKVFNDEPLDYFEASGSIEYPWVGLDLKKPVTIEKIIYAPRNDDNNIRQDDLYELFYWQKDKWISLGKQSGREPFLEYNNAPTNALLLLRNLTRGKEERIFTYSDKGQVWW